MLLRCFEAGVKSGKLGSVTGGWVTGGFVTGGFVPGWENSYMKI
jgi:hypothetical protein